MNSLAKANLFHPSNWIGFDPIFDELSRLAAGIPKLPNWPPYNVKKVDDSKYVVEMAVAGFSKSDIEVTVDGDTLVISGNTASEDNTSGEYIFKGIAERSFTRTFKLQDGLKVKSGELVNGLLKITLEAQAVASKVLRLELK